MVKMLRWSILLVLVILISSLALAEESASEEPRRGVCVYYFYAAGNPFSLAAENYLQELKKEQPQLKITEYEVYYDRVNAKLLQNYFDAYDVPENSQGIPAVFIKGSYFIGPSSIEEFLESQVKDETRMSCPSLKAKNVVGMVGEKETHNVLDTLTIGVISSSAFNNSILPVMVAVMLIMASLLIIVKKKQELLKHGIIFIAAVFAAYLLFGMGFFSGFANLKVLHLIFYKGIAVVIIILSALNIKCFFKTPAFLEKIIPQKEKELALTYLSTFYGVAIVGFISALFTFSQADANFRILRDLFGEAAFRMSVLPYLIYYAIILILPLIAVGGILYFIKLQLDKKAEKKGEKLESWQTHYHKLFHFGMNIVTLVVGVVLLLV